MSYQIIRRALEKRLFNLQPELPTSWENDTFEPPNSIHQRAFILPAATDNPSYGDTLQRESGIFQVSICTPLGAGSGAAIARATLLKAWFYRGFSITDSGLIIKIIKSPSMAPALRDGAFYVIPVSIPYQCDVY